MSTLANITSLDLTLQTGGAALAVAAAKKLQNPTRVVNVYSNASDVAPNFTTVSGALTYANSLTPIVTEPVVIRLFAKADGTPYDLTGYDFYTLQAGGTYVESPFDPWARYVLYGGVMPESELLWTIDENQLSTIVQG